MPCCQICGSNEFALIATEMREGPGRISRCESCGLVIQDVVCAPAQMREYYNREYQRSNSLDAAKEQSPREHFQSRIKTIPAVVQRINALLHNDMSVLEIGCGAGELLHSIKPRVGDVTGIEINRAFVDFMNRELGISARAQDVNSVDFGNKRFDLIICIATLDHLPDPLRTLRTMKKLLSPSGKIYIEVPNLNEALNFYLPEENRRAFNRFFWHRAHLFYFSPETISKLAEKCGLICELSCRHEYTLRNYLNWYFKGCPQATFVNAATEVGLFMGESDFEKDMNSIFDDMESRFHQVMSRTLRGDTLCCLAHPKERAAQ